MELINYYGRAAKEWFIAWIQSDSSCNLLAIVIDDGVCVIANALKTLRGRIGQDTLTSYVSIADVPS